MAMSKHTPGPWTLAEKFNCVHVRAVDGPYVADCNASAAIDWRIKEANARLIAAAPDLASALEALLERYVAAIGNEGPECWVARAAIAKAEGK